MQSKDKKENITKSDGIEVVMNPILPIQYCIPDVEARMDDKARIYLYGSKDLIGDDIYCSEEYQVFSSNDLLNWEVGDISFDKKCLKENDRGVGRLYAPDCICKNGKYYLLYCLADGSEGIAVSNSPSGVFEDLGIIEGIKGIDPTALVENDKVFYFWGQISLQGAELNLEEGNIVENTHVSDILNEKQDGFHEGSSIRKIGNRYYMVYADISRGKPTCLGYAIADRPMGPYHKKGIIIDNTGCDPSSWNNHGSIQMIQGKPYVFYHRSSENSVFSRRVCIEPITIKEDGTIEEVEMTSQGIEPYIPENRLLNACNFCLLGGKAYISVYSSKDQSFGYLTNIHDGDWACVKYYMFRKSVQEWKVWLSNVGYPCKIEVHVDQVDGEMIAEVQANRTRGNFDFVEFKGNLKRNVEGRHAIYLVFKGGEGCLMKLRDFQFSGEVVE